ncbi:hypothetical protein NDU88_006068 [Pleurodeles waltl]|uniref:Uncharacterized protein n=1 Tax=Pleurodeles waltl TaxID=8319 RepID=A0AAV7NT51_PLEWA|nr:hypothetical protein NDU88_006068 [Pleurodeles waltl]
MSHLNTSECRNEINPLVESLPHSSTRLDDPISSAHAGHSVPACGVLLRLQLVSRGGVWFYPGRVSVLTLLLWPLGVNGLGGLLCGCGPLSQTRGGLATPIQLSGPAGIWNSTLGSLACIGSDTDSSGCLPGVLQCRDRLKRDLRDRDLYGLVLGHKQSSNYTSAPAAILTTPL